jgi:hypothetical protein
MVLVAKQPDRSRPADLNAAARRIVGEFLTSMRRQGNPGVQTFARRAQKVFFTKSVRGWEVVLPPPMYSDSRGIRNRRGNRSLIESPNRAQ